MDFRFSSIYEFDFHSTVVTVIVTQLQLWLLTYGACLCVGLEYDNRG